jgi:hypothetical protein
MPRRRTAPPPRSRQPRGRRVVADKLARIWKQDAKRDPQGDTRPAVYALAVNVLLPAEGAVTHAQVKADPWRWMGLLGDPKIDRNREKLLPWFHKQFWSMRPLEHAQGEVFLEMFPWITPVVEYLLKNKSDLNTIMWNEIVSKLRAAQLQKLVSAPIALAIDEDSAWRVPSDTTHIQEIGVTLDLCFKREPFTTRYFTGHKKTFVLFEALVPVATLTLDRNGVSEFRGKHNAVSPDVYHEEAQALILKLVPNANEDIDVWGEAREAAPEHLQGGGLIPAEVREQVEGIVEQIEGYGSWGPHTLSFFATANESDADMEVTFMAEIEVARCVVEDTARRVMRQMQQNILAALAAGVEPPNTGRSRGLTHFGIVEEAIELTTEWEDQEERVTAATWAFFARWKRIAVEHPDPWDCIEEVVALLDSTLHDQFYPPSGVADASDGGSITVEFDSLELSDMAGDTWEERAYNMADEAANRCEGLENWVTNELESNLKDSVESMIEEETLYEAAEKYARRLLDEAGEGRTNWDPRGRRRRRPSDPAEEWLRDARRRLRRGFVVVDTLQVRRLVSHLVKLEASAGRRVRVKSGRRRGAAVLYVKH